MTGDPDNAIDYFKKGLEYARRQERTVQRIAIICNHLIARAYCYEPIDQNDLRRVMNQIMDSMGFHQLPFISARFAMNLIVIAFKQSQTLGKELLNDYPISALVQKAFDTNLMGSGKLLLQMKYLVSNFPFIDLLETVRVPQYTVDVQGIYREYIIRHGYNPFVFCTWL